jgi:glycosyltransferase involved in cell wall biosynthesis
MAKRLAGQNVRFLGFRHGEELSTLYASSDMFVFPSTTDTLGQVVMESQGSGLPVLVTDVGGPKEVVDHELTGYVLSATDVDAWAARLVDLIADERLRRRMGSAAYERMQRFSLVHSFEHFWEVHTKAWHDHLGRLGITRASAGIAGGGRPSDEAGTSRSTIR